MELSHLDTHTLLDSIQVGVVVHDKNTKILYANPKALQLLRLSEDQALGKGAFDPQWQFLDKFKRSLPVADYPVNQVIASQKAISNFEVGIIDSSRKEPTWVLCNAYPEFSDDQKISKIIVNFIDISSQKQEIMFENIVARANDVIIVTDADTSSKDSPKIVYVNDAFTTLTGYSKAEALGKTPKILQGKETNHKTKKAIKKALNIQSPINEQILNYTKDGTPYWLDMNIFPLKNTIGDVTHFAAIERDITEQKNYESDLKELSIRDPLTTLLNRRGFFEVAQSHISHAQRNKKSICIAMIDIDLFKDVNDNYGHETGDQALKHISQLMINFFRDCDIIGRLGGEEFSVLLANAYLESSAEKLDKFREHLAATPLILKDNQPITLTVSIGVASIIDQNQTISEVLKKADSALYKAKNLGRDRVCISRH